MYKNLFITNDLRKEMKKPLGEVISDTKKQVEKYADSSRLIITVGDLCSSKFKSDIKIFDGRTKRNQKVKTINHSLKCPNPPAMIYKDVWETVKKAIEKKENIFIEGEEDLLVIPSILLSKENDLIIYGYSPKKVCVIKNSAKIKEKVKNLIQKFRKEKFEKTVLGGTFDHLHLGHKYFLSMIKYYSKKALIGICSDEMARSKEKQEKIQPFEKRREYLKEYLEKIRLSSKLVEINDIYGPSIKDENSDSILLTQETLKNGEKINSIRKKNGLEPLNYIVLPYLLDEEGRKISSTNIRKSF